VTLSEFGVHVHHPEAGVHHVRQAAHAREIADVSGAGDTVIAVATCLFAQGVDPTEVARVANLAGGLVCENVGVVPIDAARLRIEVSSTPPLIA
jgi:D-glycero-beta-D-manno-heptose-7-phosphate kinase